MSVSSITALSSPQSGAKEIVLTPTATADDAVVGAAAKVASIYVDNSANSAASYVCLYDNADPTVGTTVPDEVIYVRAGKKRWINYVDDKLEFGTAISVACKTAGGTAGTTSPTSTVTMRMTVHS